MKTLTLLFFWSLLCPLSLVAQSADVLLQKVSEALSDDKDDYAVSLFRQALDEGDSQTEMYYWTRIDKGSKVAPRLARELAMEYKDKRNYDKAYLFYKECLQYAPEDVAVLVSCAQMQLMRGEERDAVRLYEKVMALDADNLQANIFLGNYYYLRAEREQKRMEEDYRKINTPTRMQYARYRDGLSELFATEYGKAKSYLQKVLQLFPSTEASRTLDKIKKVEVRIK